MSAVTETPEKKLFSRWGGEIPKGTPRERDLIARRGGVGSSTGAVSRVPVPLHYYCTVVNTHNNNALSDRLCCEYSQQRCSRRWS